MIPVLLDPRCALFLGDSNLVGTVLGDKSVDLIATDPPYSEHTHANHGKEKRKDGAKQREGLAFAHLSDEEINVRAREFVRLCRGWILVFTDDRSVSAWGTALERAGGRWVRTGHWVKSNPMPQMSGDRPAVGTEPLVIAHGMPSGRMKWNGGGHAAVYRGPGDRGEAKTHPNQKPLWLMQELIRLFSNPGEVVLDPFTGSGTTGVAALAGGCEFVGVEQSPEYAEGAMARLRAALATPLVPRAEVPA